MVSGKWGVVSGGGLQNGGRRGGGGEAGLVAGGGFFEGVEIDDAEVGLVADGAFVAGGVEGGDEVFRVEEILGVLGLIEVKSCRKFVTSRRGYSDEPRA